MRIALDVSGVPQNPTNGVGVYTANLVNSLAMIDSENTYFICHRLSRVLEDKRGDIFKIAQPSFKLKLIQDPFNFLLLCGIDIFHGTVQRLSSSVRAKKVVTIHDIMSVACDEITPEGLRAKKRRKYQRLTRDADVTVVSSDFVKKEMLRFYDIPPEKIRVIYSGVGEHFYPRQPREINYIQEKYGIDRSYFFFCGALTKRKNILRLLEAFAIARNRTGEDIYLVLAGGLDRGDEEILNALKRPDLTERVKLIGCVPAEDLPPLYSGAKAFLFPSLYEGFGLPPLEAMACGTPVITSNITSLPEVVGEAALLVNPKDTSELAETMVRILKDEGLQANLISRGIAQARKFRWETTARETLLCYQELVKG